MISNIAFINACDDSGFNAKLIAGQSIQGTDTFQTLDELFVITRGPVVRMYAIFIVITICALRLSSSCSQFHTHVMHQGQLH